MRMQVRCDSFIANELERIALLKEADAQTARGDVYPAAIVSA